MSPLVKWKCIKHFIPSCIPVYFEESSCLVFPLPYKYFCYSPYKAISGCWCFNTGVTIMLLDVCSNPLKCTWFWNYEDLSERVIRRKELKHITMEAFSAGSSFCFNETPAHSFLSILGNKMSENKNECRRPLLPGRLNTLLS